MYCGHTVVHACCLQRVHLSKPKVASHIHGNLANTRKHKAENDILQCQEELRKADWLAEPKCACVEQPCRRNGHLHACKLNSESMPWASAIAHMLTGEPCEVPL